jgi:signal transduction histidine kinase
VTLTLALQGGQAELSVADQGPGVSAEMLPYLFERFSTQKAARRPAHGTGLGLYFVHNVAERHGGQAGYEALTPVGARLWVRLPRL